MKIPKTRGRGIISARCSRTKKGKSQALRSCFKCFRNYCQPFVKTPAPLIIPAFNA